MNAWKSVIRKSTVTSGLEVQDQLASLALSNFRRKAETGYERSSRRINKCLLYFQLRVQKPYWI